MTKLKLDLLTLKFWWKAPPKLPLSANQSSEMMKLNNSRQICFSWLQPEAITSWKLPFVIVKTSISTAMNKSPQPNFFFAIPSINFAIAMHCCALENLLVHFAPKCYKITPKLTQDVRDPSKPSQVVHIPYMNLSKGSKMYVTITIKNQDPN